MSSMIRGVDVIATPDPQRWQVVSTKGCCTFTWRNSTEHAPVVEPTAPACADCRSEVELWCLERGFVVSPTVSE